MSGPCSRISPWSISPVQQQLLPPGRCRLAAAAAAAAFDWQICEPGSLKPDLSRNRHGCSALLELRRRAGLNHSEAINSKSESEFRSDSALINFGFVCLINLLIARPSIQISRTAPTGVNAENINTR